MKAFLSRLFIFATLLILYFLANYSINLYLIHSHQPRTEGTILMGDSHIMTAVNDANYPGSVNLAQEGEPYTVTYFKIRKLAATNRIDTIILGFSPHNISAFNDRKFSTTYWSGELFDRIYPLVTLEDLKPLEVNYTSYALAIVKNMLLYPHSNHKSYLGHFSRRKEQLDTTKKSPDEAITRHYYLAGKELGPSSLSIQYLDSITGFCTRNKVHLVLLSTPLHREYKKKIPKMILSRFQELKQLLEVNGFQVIDFSEDPYPNQYFADYDHLNEQGSFLLTRKLATGR